VADELRRQVADPRPIVAALVGDGVDFLIVGGLAVIAHGHVRVTRDVDILPAPDTANLHCLAAALRGLDAAAIGARGQRLPLDLSHPESLSVGDYSLDTRFGGVDLVNGPRPDLRRYRRLEAAAVPSTIDGHAVKVISKDDLIAMKREAGRPKDLADIAALTEVERGGGL
jgi:hypothetical protein